MTKTFAALGILGAALFAFAACNDSSGDALITGAPSASGVPTKYALQLTVDSTGSNIKVGDKAITDSNGGDDTTDTTGTIIADDATEGEAELKLSATGKRAFKEITAGLNNTEGFRTNIVLDLKNGTWKNGSRTAGTGFLFDFNQYKDAQSKKIYDFFFLSFKPVFGGENGAFSGVTCFFERYSGVKKYKEGIYSGHDAASALGDNYVPTDTNGTWDQTKIYTAADKKTWSKSLSSTNDYIYNSTEQTVTIGVDVKQQEKGVYTVRIGKIRYTVGDGTSETTQEFTPSAFKQSWHTYFTAGTTMGKGGETSTKTGDTGYIKNGSTNYLNWTHVDKDNKDTNLKGGVLVYGFAPYGTKPVACYYTCNTQLSSGQTDDGNNTRYDFVGDWNRANELDTGAGNSSVIYEEGNVIHEYYYY